MFALVDCNNFFASCEMVFNPKLELKPLAILSNNDGCIIARSSKAKRIGMKMGEPAFHYRNRKDIEMLSSNFTLYADMSQRVMNVLSSFTPDMEIYSIDEAFLLLEKETSLEKAKEIKQKIEQWTGLKVSIGIGKTKTLAKLANEKAKKGNGVAIFEENWLAKTAVEEIWGIGRQLALLLKKKGVYNAEQLKNADDTWIRKQLSITGFQTVLELRGVSCLNLIATQDKKKSIVVSRSFGTKIEELTLLQEAASTFVTRAAEKLRKQKSKAAFLSVFLITDDLTNHSTHIQIPQPTSFTPELIALAKQGVAKAYSSYTKYKKAGVLLTDFTDENQSDFFVPEINREKKEKAMEVLDQINAQFGKTTIQFGSLRVSKTPVWKSVRGHCSPNFTTSWDELLKVK